MFDLPTFLYSSTNLSKGNVVLWKPSPMATYSNYLVYQILREAGLPDGVVQFLPADAELMTKVACCDLVLSRYFV